MTKKRYAIVRVDDKCPLYLREFTDKEAQDMFCCSGKYTCKNCRYGDTKEQLILKIAQVLIREVLADIKIKVDKRTLEELTKMQRQSAEKIIDFLGVK